MNSKKIILIIIIATLISSFFLLDLGSYLNLEYVKSQQHNLQRWVADNTLMAAAAFLLIYTAVTALSLPGATVMTLIGGAGKKALRLLASST